MIPHLEWKDFVDLPVSGGVRLGIGPGSVIEWDDNGGQVVVRRAGRYSSSEVHEEVFPYGTQARKSAEEIKAGIRANVKKRHARRLHQKRSSLGFSDCLVVEAARKAGHGPLGTFDRELGKLEGAQLIRVR
jgi:predicted nucleic acid-binding protein